MARLLLPPVLRTPVIEMDLPWRSRNQDEEVVCESLVMSALRRSVEV
jgi:hypothetical protein